eukprot:6927257-Pyramimonas_sp.AAC.1
MVRLPDSGFLKSWDITCCRLMGAFEIIFIIVKIPVRADSAGMHRREKWRGCIPSTALVLALIFSGVLVSICGSTLGGTVTAVSRKGLGPSCACRAPFHNISCCSRMPPKEAVM